MKNIYQFKRITLIFILSVIAMVSAYAGITYHGNVKSGVFHAPSCRYYDCKNCNAVFHSRQDAINAGYRPCKICNP